MRRFDAIFEAHGGIRAYVLGRRERGDKVEDILRSMNAASPEVIAERTLWHWVSKWEKPAGMAAK